MKAYLLSALTFMSFLGTSVAQNGLYVNFAPDIRWDAGINYGASVITRPLGPDKAYQGTRTNIVPDISARVQYAISEHFHAYFDVGSRKWETFGTWQEPYLMGQTLKPQEISFLEAQRAITETFMLNYNIPFYSRYQDANIANLYFGIAAGLVTTINDGSKGYSKYNAPPDSNYTYMSCYHYGAGIGYSFGVQAGFTYYFFRRLGINVEIAARMADVGTESVNGQDYVHQTNRYRVLFFPETFGIRYRFR